MVNMVTLVSNAKSAKFADTMINTLARTAKGAKYYARSPKKPRLFSIRRDNVCGTEITNNITGTRYLQRGGVQGGMVAVEPLTTIHRADGSFTGMESSKFNALLKNLESSPENWNPVIKSDAIIGKELCVNNPKIAGRYFRHADSIDGQLIKRITAEHHSSMRLEEFDKMILDLLG